MEGTVKKLQFLSLVLVVLALPLIVGADMTNKKLGMSPEITGWFVLGGAALSVTGLFIGAFVQDVINGFLHV